MKEKVMILKVKENNNFREKKSARLFNSEEMKKFTELVSIYVLGGWEIKVELIEMKVKK